MAQGYAELNPVRAGDSHFTLTFPLQLTPSPTTRPQFFLFHSQNYLKPKPISKPGAHRLLSCLSISVQMVTPMASWGTLPPYIPLGWVVLHPTAVKLSWRGAPWASACCSPREPGLLVFNAGFSARFCSVVTDGRDKAEAKGEILGISSA